MRSRVFRFLAVLLLSISAVAVSKPHVIALGKATTVRSVFGDSTTGTIELKIRPLYVDGRLKEYTSGAIHDITDRLFVVQRTYRMNDSLPTEAAPRWVWLRGGWLLVDRATGRISQLNFTDFHPYYSTASWYRDYVAYCGVADEADTVYAVVAQVGRRKPIVRTIVRGSSLDDKPPCAFPTWQVHPTRVSFEPAAGQKLMFDVKGRALDLAKEEEEDQGD